MRTHWGWATVNCMSCREAICFLLIARHKKQGLNCPKCHRQAVCADRAARMIGEVEEGERGLGSGRQREGPVLGVQR